VGDFLVGADARPLHVDLGDMVAYLAGFDDNRPATAIADELMVRTIAISAPGEEPVVLSVCDLIGLTRVHEDKGRRVVACTHTHHAPDTIGFWGQPMEGVSGRVPAFDELVRSTVSASQDAALSAMEPASIRAGSASVAGLVANLRNPDVVDDEVSVLVADDLEGQRIATLVSFGCHPEVVAPDNTEITADYAGYTCRELELRHGGVAALVVGALGGMQSPSTDIHTHAEAARFGVALADAVTALQLNSVGDGVRFARTDIVVRLINPIYQLGAEMGLVPQPETRNDGVVTEVSMIRIGDVALACLPGELLPELGLQLKADLRAGGVRVPAIVGLADDEVGYILPKEDFVEPADYLDPGKQYEESLSIGPDIGPAVMAAVRALDLATR